MRQELENEIAKVKDEIEEREELIAKKNEKLAWFDELLESEDGEDDVCENKDEDVPVVSRIAYAE